ncbi:hypothetical protein [Sphingobacterium mizutaii]|uniref:type IV pilus modification PilV family protein n=1 Tax=Sphingobacterium mizutaii TaxID=1010 RepID=UPI001624520F|nr:hypothetical protein [Sphingobacterium mizutaii]
MAELKCRKKYHLKASTLIEVLIAMIILLTVFSIGILIFTKLTTSVKSNSKQDVQWMMKQIKFQYLNHPDFQDPETAWEHHNFTVQEDRLTGYPDLRKITIYAMDFNQDRLSDSLVFLKRIYEE